MNFDDVDFIFFYEPCDVHIKKKPRTCFKKNYYIFF